MESDGDEDMKNETYSNSTEGSSSDAEDINEEKIKELQQQVKDSPFTYDLHVQLISLCRKAGDLEKLRDAREEMNKLFPLSPDLWVDWLTDEKTIASNDEQKEALVKLFERAIKDYPSVSVWMEYVQFSLGQIGESWESALENVRAVFEKAITSVGIHVAQGYLVWAAYQEMESLYLMYLKSKESNEEKVKKQEEKILSLFKRQLSVPLLDMEKVYSEFEAFCKCSSIDVDSIEYSYKKASAKLQQLLTYEEALNASEPPHYEEYKRYIEHEKQGGEPIRVQSLFERAIIDNCLKDELWSEFSKFVDQTIKIKEISLPVHERAVRNCPWSSQLWVNYGKALERYAEAHETIKGSFETALEMGFTKEEDFRDLWLAYLDYLRRKIYVQNQLEDTEVDFREIEAVFERAITQMSEYFWSSESEYVISKYWIFFNAKYKKDLETSRKCWKQLLDAGRKEETRVWLEYANFERLYGDASHYRKCLFQALCCVNDYPETFSNLLITYEREEGTLETLESALSKCEVQQKLRNDKLSKKIRQEEASSIVEKLNTSQSSRQKRNRFDRQESPSKRSHEESDSSVVMDSEGFKIPPVPGKASPSPDSPGGGSREEETRKRKNSGGEDEPQSKKMKEDASESHGTSVKHDSSKDDRTVFVSNLSFDIEEDKIKEFFSKIGEVEDIRLVKDYKGRSKGFCYVVYKSELDAQSAMKKDRSPLHGRPVLVSPCRDKKSNSSAQSAFKFGTGLELNKLFVKGLPFSTTKEDLEEMFKECGKLKDVRIVTYRNGHSKGIAYVEYVNEADASNAVVKMDGSQVQGHVISVAISNPPPRKPQREPFSARVSESLGGGSLSGKGPRGRGRSQISLLPRSIARPPAASKRPPNAGRSVQNGQNSDSSALPAKKLSNSDFANMLKK